MPCSRLPSDRAGFRAQHLPFSCVVPPDSTTEQKEKKKKRIGDTFCEALKE